MQLKIYEQNREKTLEQPEFSSLLLGLSATFGTGVDKDPEVIKNSFQSCPRDSDAHCSSVRGAILSRLNTTEFCTTFKFVSHFNLLKHIVLQFFDVVHFQRLSCGNSNLDSNDPHQPGTGSSWKFPSADTATQCQEYSTEHFQGRKRKSSVVRARFSWGSPCASDLSFKTTFSFALIPVLSFSSSTGLAARPRSAHSCSWHFLSATSPFTFEFISISRCWTFSFSRFNFLAASQLLCPCPARPHRQSHADGYPSTRHSALLALKRSSSVSSRWPSRMQRSRQQT